MKNRKTPKDLKKQSSEILKRLKKKYPVAACALNFSNAFELLVATILSAQCTDQRVNIVTENLFRTFKNPEDYATASQEEMEQAIKSINFFRNKAKNIRTMAQKIIDDFNGKVPDTLKELITLPGVARKTANVVLGVWFKKNEGIVVDTHVKRLSNRLGLTKHEAPPKVEQDLMKLIPQNEWEEFSLRLILHGRETCIARKPKCRECEMVDICPASIQFLS